MDNLCALADVDQVVQSRDVTAVLGGRGWRVLLRPLSTEAVLRCYGEGPEVFHVWFGAKS